MASGFEVEDLHFFVGMVSPIAKGVFANQQHLDGTTDVVALNVVADAKWIVPKLTKEAGEEVLFTTAQRTKRVDDFSSNEYSIGRHYSPVLPSSFFQSSRVVHLVGSLSSMRRVISVRQASSC